MCRHASMIAAKKQMFWSKKTDSHEDIIEEFGLKERDIRGNIQLVRVEIVPPYGNYLLPLSKWVFRLDQDLLPEWYDAKDVERRTRKHLKEWKKYRVVLPKQSRELRNGESVLVCGGTVKAYDNSLVEAYGYSMVEAYSNSTVVAWDNSAVEAHGYSAVEAHGNSTVVADSSTVVAYSNSTVVAWDNSTVEARDNSTVKAWGNSTVKAYGKSTIIAHTKLSKNILKSRYAVMIDRSGEKPECYVGR